MVTSSSNVTIAGKPQLVNNPITISDRDDCAKGVYNSGYKECPNEYMVSFYTNGGFCVPEGVTRISYIMIGGGGGGGGGAGCYGGGGGGAGQIVQGHFLATGGARVDVAVGAAGYSGGRLEICNCPIFGSTPCEFPYPNTRYGCWNRYTRNNGGRPGGDTVITVTCKFTGGYTIRARGGCGGSAAYGGKFCVYHNRWWGCAHGGSGGHSWLPVYQINYPAKRTVYKLSPCNAYYCNQPNAGSANGFRPYTDSNIQYWIKNYGREPYDTGLLGSSSTGYINRGVFKICPVQQPFRPQGVTKSPCVDRTRSGAFSQSWWNQIRTTTSTPYTVWYPTTFDPWACAPVGMPPKVLTGICANSNSPRRGYTVKCQYGGGGASGFGHGGITKSYTTATCNVITRYVANYKNPNANPATYGNYLSATGVRRTIYYGFGTVCRHRFCDNVWCSRTDYRGSFNYYTTTPTRPLGFPAGSISDALPFVPGGDGIPTYYTQLCVNKSSTSTCIKSCPSFKYGCDIWYCLYCPNCCGIRNSGYDGIGYKQCGAKTYSNIYKLNGWGKGGRGGITTSVSIATAPYKCENWKGPGSGGNGGDFYPGPYCRYTGITSPGTGYSGCLGQKGAVIFHYQIRLNSSVIREILEGGANTCEFPCIPNKPPTLSKAALYTCPNIISGKIITGVGMATAKSPERVLAFGNSLVAVQTPNPNYRPELPISVQNPVYWYPTFYQQIKCCDPLSMLQFYGRCFIKSRYNCNPVNIPPPALDPPTPLAKNPVYTNINYYFWGGGGGGGTHSLTASSLCSIGGAGGGGGGLIVSGTISLLSSKNFSKYRVVIGAGGRGGTQATLDQGGCGNSTYILCYSCGTAGYKGAASYGARVSGTAYATGGSAGTNRRGGFSTFSGGCAYRCATLPNYGGGGGGGGTGSRGTTGGPGGCPLVGGDGGLGTRLSYVNKLNRGAGIASYTIGGGGGGGGGYTGGTGATRSAGGYGRGAGGLCRTYAKGCGGGYYPSSVIYPLDGGINSGNGGGGGGANVYLCYVYVYVPPPPPPPKGFLDFIGGAIGLLAGGLTGGLAGVAIGAYLNGLAVQTNGYSYVDPRYKSINAGSSAGYGGSGGAMISYNSAGGQQFDVLGCGDTIQTANSYYHVFWGSGCLIGRG